jgi:hypothetical protein
VLVFSASATKLDSLFSSRDGYRNLLSRRDQLKAPAEVGWGW